MADRPPAPDTPELRARWASLAAAFAAVISTSAIAAEPQDIVIAAVDAIVEKDAAALNGLKFNASDLNKRPISADQLIAELSRCDLLEKLKLSEPGRRYVLRYKCSERLDKKGQCDSDVLVVSLDRATTPHVFAQLNYKRFDTPECALPQIPMPG